MSNAEDPIADNRAPKRQSADDLRTHNPNRTWHGYAYPVQQITIQLQGQRNSRREDILSRLEIVLAHWTAGDACGENSDDEFGQKFELIAAEPRVTVRPCARAVPSPELLVLHGY
jgi:hypothetical protein